MRLRNRTVFISLFALLLFSRTAFADILHLKNGETVEGVITEEYAGGVMIELPIGTISFSHNEIEKIEKKEFTLPEKESPETTVKTSMIIYKGRSYTQERFDRLVKQRGLVQHEGGWITQHQKKGMEIAAMGGSADKGKIAEYASPAVVSVKVDDSKQGSGVLINSNGLFLTNYHVVKDAKNIRVKLYNEDTEHTARVVTTKETWDLALVSIGGTDHPFLKLADPEKVKVGQEVMALGNPFGLSTTVTTGIISSLRKLKDFPGVKKDDLKHWQRELEIIQTDAAINSGNSGGPLLNKSGEIVGINTFTIAKAFAEGLNFAIHARYIKRLFYSYFE